MNPTSSCVRHSLGRVFGGSHCDVGCITDKFLSLVLPYGCGGLVAASNLLSCRKINSIHCVVLSIFTFFLSNLISAISCGLLLQIVLTRLQETSIIFHTASLIIRLHRISRGYCKDGQAPYSGIGILSGIAMPSGHFRYAFLLPDH